MTEEEYAELERTAQTGGKTLGEWCREVMLASVNGHGTTSQPSGGSEAQSCSMHCETDRSHISYALRFMDVPLISKPCRPGMHKYVCQSRIAKKSAINAASHKLKGGIRRCIWRGVYLRLPGHLSSSWAQVICALPRSAQLTAAQLRHGVQLFFWSVRLESTRQIIPQA